MRPLEKVAYSIIPPPDRAQRTRKSYPAMNKILKALKEECGADSRVNPAKRFCFSALVAEQLP